MREDLPYLLPTTHNTPVMWELFEFLGVSEVPETLGDE